MKCTLPSVLLQLTEDKIQYWTQTGLPEKTGGEFRWEIVFSKNPGLLFLLLYIYIKFNLGKKVTMEYLLSIG